MIGIILIAPCSVMMSRAAAVRVLPVRLAGATLTLAATAFVLWGPRSSARVTARLVVHGRLVAGNPGSGCAWLGRGPRRLAGYSDGVGRDARTLLSILRGEAFIDDRPSLADECAALRTAREPVVVSARSTTATVDRYDCVDGLLVVTASG